MRTESVTTAENLRRLAPAWEDLFDRVREAPPFASPAWLLPWWHVFAPGQLACVAVWEAGRLAAFAPLYIEDGPERRRLLPMGIGISDSMDVLIDPAYAAEAGADLAAAIGAGRSAWDCWSAEEADRSAAVLALPDPPGCRSTTGQQSASPVLALLTAGAGLDAAIPAGKRRKWRMAQHRVARRSFSLDATDAATLSGDLDHLFRLHGARWQSRGEAGVLADPAVVQFHRAAAPVLLAAGLLRGLTLRIDGVVAGVYYGFRRGRAAFAYLGGFDPAFAFESPGTLLLGAAIEQAATEGASEFHFLRGQEPYKYEWGAVDRWTTRRLFEPLR